MASDELEAEYRRRMAADKPVQQCCFCLVRGAKNQMEPHHPNGRHGENILDYKWIHAWCHRLAKNSIHERPAIARKLGLYHNKP